MKKKMVAVMLATAMVFSLAACGGKTDGSASADTKTEDTASTDEFNPDQAEDAMTIEELRDANGAEVAVEDGLKLGAVEKSLSNEFWRTLQEGYEKAADNVTSATGGKFEIEVEATTDESDETGQQTMTETLTTQGVDALMLSPISDSNLTAAVENAQDANVPVVK